MQEGNIILLIRNLENNHLEGPIPHELGRLTNLEYLYVVKEERGTFEEALFSCDIGT